MKNEIQEAMNEIMDIPPIYRRDYIVKYIRENLSREDARRYLFEKTKRSFIRKMIDEGFITPEEVVEKIGKDRVRIFFHKISSMS